MKFHFSRCCGIWASLVLTSVLWATGSQDKDASAPLQERVSEERISLEDVYVIRFWPVLCRTLEFLQKWGAQITLLAGDERRSQVSEDTDVQSFYLKFAALQKAHGRDPNHAEIAIRYQAEIANFARLMNTCEQGIQIFTEIMQNPSSQEKIERCIQELYAEIAR